MNENSKSFSWGFWIVWILLTLLGVVAAFWVWFIVLMILSISLPFLPNYINLFAASLVLATTYGSVIGLSQRSVLVRRAPEVKGWVWASMVGVFIAGPLLVLGSGWFSPYAPVTSALAMAAGLGLALGVAQWFVLRKEVIRAPVWIGFSLLAWLAGGWLGYLLWTSNLEWGAILYWIAVYFLGTALSATAMAFWLKPAAVPTTEPEPG